MTDDNDLDAAIHGTATLPTLLRDLPGTVFVTRHVADDYADFCELRHEEARQELTRLLRDARMIHESVGDGPSNWRHRTAATGLDISVRVIDDGDGLLVVTSINVRHYRRKSGRRGKGSEGRKRRARGEGK